MKCQTHFLAESAHAFQEDLYSYYNQFSKDEDLVSPLTLLSFSRVLDKLCKISNIQPILDVGCGKGEFVWAAKNMGYVIKGIELSREAVSVARCSDLPVQQQSLFSEELESSTWNTITMFEVLEHVDNPLSFIKRAADLLAPNGLLYLTTPNYSSLDRFFLK